MALTLCRRLRYGWRGVPVNVAGVTFLVGHRSGSEFRRARNFAAWEPEFLTAFCQAIGQARVVYDIGAATGLYTILAARANPSAQIYAFEPQSNNHQALMTNIALNQLANVTALKIALGDTNGTASLQQRGGGEIAGLGTHRIGASAGAGMPVVELTTVDRLVASAEAPPPDVIKMDIEGFETRAVRGMRETLRKYRPELLIELHPRAIAELGDDPGDLDAFLDELGYDREVLHEPSATTEQHSQFHVRYTARRNDPATEPNRPQDITCPPSSPK
jgi:FkbM family methyltransferase